MEALLEPHYEATRRRVAVEPLVFAVPATTRLNYSTHRETGELGPMGKNICGLRWRSNPWRAGRKSACRGEANNPRGGRRCRCALRKSPCDRPTAKQSWAN
jgi:hypothetical protein